MKMAAQRHGGYFPFIILVCIHKDSICNDRDLGFNGSYTQQDLLYSCKPLTMRFLALDQVTAIIIFDDSYLLSLEHP